MCAKYSIPESTREYLGNLSGTCMKRTQDNRSYQIGFQDGFACGLEAAKKQMVGGGEKENPRVHDEKTKRHRPWWNWCAE